MARLEPLPREVRGDTNHLRGRRRGSKRRAGGGRDRHLAVAVGVGARTNAGLHRPGDRRGVGDGGPQARTTEAGPKVAATTGKSEAQVALNWVVNQPGVTAPIIGARNEAQLDANLGAVGWTLNQDQRVALTWASAFPRGYPYDFIEYANHE
jgi:Aldo/keto reductase family